MKKLTEENLYWSMRMEGLADKSQKSTNVRLVRLGAVIAER